MMMEEELIKILSIFYCKLQNNIIREEKKLKNDSVLWTLIEMQSKKTEKYLANASFSIIQFPIEKLRLLQEKGFISSAIGISGHEEFIYTSKGIWEYEKISKQFSEEHLLSFIQSKYFTFAAKSKPLDEKEKLAIFSLLCVRNFSIDVPMDLTSEKFRDNWNKIFKATFDFLKVNNFLESTSSPFEKIFPTKGSEHPVQYLMRRRNDLPIKTNQLFCFIGNSKYYLNLWQNDRLELNSLKYLFKLIFNEISDFETALNIANFCIDIANDNAKFVITSYHFIDPKYDEIIRNVIKEIYVG
jgi:hypothetical protein